MKPVCVIRIISRWSLVAVLIMTYTITKGQMNRVSDTAYLYPVICKTVLKVPMNKISLLDNAIAQNSKRNSSLITVHGNIQYDYLFRSFTDTPFYQNDFRQHTVQTSLTVTIKDRYPFQVNMILRKSNSPFFKDFFDGGIVFNRFSYQNKIKQEMLEKISRQIPGQEYLTQAKALLDKEIEKYGSLKAQLNSIDLTQKIIEQREKKYYQSIEFPGATLPQTPKLIDSLSKNVPVHLGEKNIADQIDTLAETYSQKLLKERRKLDSLQDRIRDLQMQIDSVNKKVTGDIYLVRQKIARANNSKDFSKVLKEYGIEETKKRSENFIADLKTVGIGRTVLNYSELTAWNVSLTGLNLEYNPGVYAAFAAGKIDYGFRDFFGKSLKQKNQDLFMGRFGFGDKEKRAIIVSLFTGRKNYGNVFRDSLSNHVNVMGYSIETVFKRDRHTYLSAELAKTTRPLTGPFKENNGLKHLVNFSNNANLGLSIKGETLLQQTNTKLSGFYRKTGESFQSFSLFTYNTNQTAWLLRFDQPFLNNKLGVTAMLRRNDFINPFAQQTFKTSTVFKSFQVNMRIPKWPVLSAGYYPGSQLYIVDGKTAHENAYYIMNGSLTHSYSSGATRMISSLIYNRYSSKGTDTGFIAYKGVTYMASQTFIMGKMQLQGQYTYTDQEQMQFFTLESNIDYSILSLFQLGAGGKYNKVTAGKTYLGGQAGLRIEIRKLGTLQLQYEKSYLPTTQQTLFPIEMGRVSWFKTF